MCRLFGFRSVIPSQVHRSLVAAENALSVQSQKHPDGWGVAYYVDGCPHVTRSDQTALGDLLFQRVSGVVSSQTVLAHVRQATRGTASVLNSHPFQYGKWVGAHNGDIPTLERVRAALRAEITPGLLRFVLGETDSELLFFQFLSRLGERAPLGETHTLASVVEALRSTLQRTREISDAEGERSTLTLMVTDGQLLVACHGGKQLHYSTYKRRCVDRDTCQSLSEACEAATRTGFVNHLIVSSEPLQGENVWTELGEGSFVGIDRQMKVVCGSLDSGSLDTGELPVLGVDLSTEPHVHLPLESVRMG